MASEEAVMACLAVLGRAFAGTVDKARVDVYAAALEDLSDDELKAATTIVVKNHTGEFIPPPAVIRKAVTAAPAVDTDEAIAFIRALSVYNPNVGMIRPAIETVRQSSPMLGYAYAFAGGGDALFSENAVTADIARREFQRGLVEATAKPESALRITGSSVPQLGEIDPRAAKLIGAPALPAVQ